MNKDFIKNIYQNNQLAYFLLHPIKRLRDFFRYSLKSDKQFLADKYRKAFGYDIDFDNPRTLNEKIIWLKLNDRTPLHTLCADKYAVRNYIEEKIGDKYLVPLLYHTSDPQDITPSNIPDIPCIIKTNHDSGGGVFVYEKKNMDWGKIRQVLSRRMKENYYPKSKEWQYKNISPIITVEKLLIGKDGKIPNDYKLHCFNGKVRMIQVDIGRGSENHYRNWYNTDWEREPYKWSSPKGNGKFTDPSKFDIEKPLSLQKMIDLSEELAKPFSYVRIDWYDVDGKLYFGEFTFHHDGGTKPILPKEWDLKLGQELNLKMHDTKN